jgi:hypothetical protein
VEVERFCEELDRCGREQEGRAKCIEYSGSEYDISWFGRGAMMEHLLVVDRIVGLREANSFLIQLCGLFVETLSLAKSTIRSQPSPRELGL